MDPPTHKKGEDCVKENNNLSLNNNNLNEINMIIKINEDDINKDIYFIYNIENKDNIMNLYNNNEKIIEMNELNTVLLINNIKYTFKKYFNFEKPGEYSIKLRLNFLIKDCSFMFYNCKQLTNIDLSNLNSSNIINIDRMFCRCENIININLPNLETKNIISMRSLFF